MYLYRFLNENNQIIYIGKTTQDIKDRFNTHRHLLKKCYESTTKIECADLNSESDLGVYEIYYINKFKPQYNTASVWDGELTINLPELKWYTYEESKMSCESLNKIYGEEFSHSDLVKRGLKKARKSGVKLGRPATGVPKEFIREYNKFQSGEYGNMSVVQFAKLQSIAVSTFYKYVGILRQEYIKKECVV